MKKSIAPFEIYQIEGAWFKDIFFLKNKWNEMNRKFQKKTPEEERNQNRLPATWIEGKKLRARSSLRIMVLTVGHGCSPSSPRSPSVRWAEDRLEWLDSSSAATTADLLLAGHMIKGLKPQTFHTGYYIVLMTSDFSSSFKGKPFLVTETEYQSLSDGLMEIMLRRGVSGLWKTCAWNLKCKGRQMRWF